MQLFVLGALPLLLTAGQIFALVKGHTVAVDFSQGPWVAGHRLLAGFSPYPGAHSPQLEGIAFVYPAVAAILLAPFSLLQQSTAALIFTVLSIIAVLVTLRILDVRDWRVYAVALIWPAVMSGWETGNITLLLGLGLSLIWRCRDRPAVTGGLIALVISMKLFLWPLGLWLIATKRYRALAWGVALGLVMNLLTWALIGFDQLTLYRSLVSTLANNQESRGYSLVALGLNHGLHRPLAYGLALGAAALAAVACVAVGRRRDGQAAFALSLACSLLATPISWLHYFALLIIPLAIVRPRLSPIWLLPLVFQFPTVGPTAWQTTITFALVAAMSALALYPKTGIGGSDLSRPTVPFDPPPDERELASRLSFR